MQLKSSMLTSLFDPYRAKITVRIIVWKGAEMDDSKRDQAARRGYGEVKKVIHTATLLHNGWEMDNEGWIVELEDGRRAALTTNNGGVYPWTRKEAEEKLAETEASAASIRKALELWPAD